jgi:SpoIID/LytB domain protein
MKSTARFLALLIFLAFAIAGFSYQQVFAQSTTEIQSQKQQKQKELEAILKDIEQISNSRASLSTKIKELETERTKLESVITFLKADLKRSEDLYKQQETDLQKVSEQYALNHALYDIETKKNLGVMFFESENIRDVMDRLLYFSLQNRLITEQRDFIITKRTGLEKTKKENEEEQKKLSASLQSVNEKIASLQAEQQLLNARYRQSTAARAILTSDIKNLSKKEQDILNNKATNAPPTSSTPPSGAGSNGGTTAPPSGSVISTGAVDVFLGDTLIKSTDHSIRIRAKSNGDVRINALGSSIPSSPYQGTLEFHKNNRRTFTGAEGTKTVNFVNDINVDLYLRGLGEMPSSWGAAGGMEALKAQVVAARTYTYRKMLNGASPYDLVDTTDDQNYVGVGKVYSSYGQYWDQAVSGTTGVGIIQGGSPISAYYSSSGGGYGLSTQEVWGGYRAYALGGTDRRQVNGTWRDYGEDVGGFSTSNWHPSANTTQSTGWMEHFFNAAIFLDPENDGVLVSSTERQKLTGQYSDWNVLMNHLGDKSIQKRVGQIQEVNHIYDDGGQVIGQNSKYTRHVEIKGTLGTIRVNGQAFRTAFNLVSSGKNAIWSSLFDIKAVSGGWQMWSRGYGHRVGMSQYGAYGRSRAGQDYKTILKAYYSNVDVVQYNVGRNVRVGVTKVGGKTNYVKSDREIEIFEGNTLIKTVPAETTVKIVYN